MLSTDTLNKQIKDAYENTGDSQRASEAMFARKVILVEGESEALILPYFFDLLGYDYIAASFARDKEDIIQVKKLINENGSNWF